MKDTGIVRRIDELGRIVIPKEIRKQLMIKEGESISFFMKDDKIVLSKYSYLSKITSSIQRMLEVLYKRYNNVFMFCDLKEVIVVSSNGLSDFQRLKVDEELLRMICMKKDVVEYEMIIAHKRHRVSIIPVLFEQKPFGAIMMITLKTPYIQMESEVLKFVKEVIEQEIEECV